MDPVKVFRTAFFGAVIALAMWSGMAVENHRAVRAGGKPLAMVALNQCKHFLGILVVTRDGKIVEMPGLPIEAAQVLAKELPEGSAVAVNTPCGPPQIGT